jgi:hypothetical protein
MPLAGNGSYRLKLLAMLGIGLVIVSSVAAFAFFSSRPTIIRYRLTLQVKVDDVVHTGSTVIEARWSAPGPLAQGSRLPVTVHGQAVVVDLGPNGYLFAILDGPPTEEAGTHKIFFPDEPVSVFTMAFLHKGAGGITSFSMLHDLAARQETVTLSPDELPMLVRFRDIGDPTTVVQVDPHDLSASFGSDTKLIGASVAITNDPVMIDIEKTLPWLKGLNGGYLTGKHSSSAGLTGTLGAGSFEM